MSVNKQWNKEIAQGGINEDKMQNAVHFYLITKYRLESRTKGTM